MRGGSRVVPLVAYQTILPKFGIMAHIKRFLMTPQIIDNGLYMTKFSLILWLDVRNQEAVVQRGTSRELLIILLHFCQRMWIRVISFVFFGLLFHAGRTGAQVCPTNLEGLLKPILSVANL